LYAVDGKRTVPFNKAESFMQGRVSLEAAGQWRFEPAAPMEGRSGVQVSKRGAQEPEVGQVLRKSFRKRGETNEVRCLLIDTVRR
jgi:hypothetical protein